VQKGSSGSSLEPLFDGPFEVERPGDKVFRVKIGGKTETVTVDCLKPYLGEATPSVAVPPRRGRPPASSAAGTRLYVEVVNASCGQPE
jgi:hypothetical protein